jgi:hypothetical protein
MNNINVHLDHPKAEKCSGTIIQISTADMRDFQIAIQNLLSMNKKLTTELH